jgi:hypothetical protein
VILFLVVVCGIGLVCGVAIIGVIRTVRNVLEGE